MRIIEDYNQQDTQPILVEDAKYIGDYAIRIYFKDGSEKLVDFKPFLIKSQHPSIKKYLNENLFSNYKIIDGNLNWNDYDMIFPVWDLYNGKISS